MAVANDSIHAVGQLWASGLCRLMFLLLRFAGDAHPEVVHAAPEVVNDGGANNSEPAMMDLSDNDDEVMAPADDEALTAFWEPSFMIKLCQDAFLCASVDKHQ